MLRRSFATGPVWAASAFAPAAMAATPMAGLPVSLLYGLLLRLSRASDSRASPSTTRVRAGESDR